MIRELPARSPGTTAAKSGTAPPAELIEVALLLPAERLADLLVLSRRADQSVAQFLRNLIDRAVAAAD
jgi:hypothetical protein